MVLPGAARTEALGGLAGAVLLEVGVRVQDSRTGSRTVAPSAGVSGLRAGGIGAWKVSVSARVGEGSPRVPSAATPKTRTNRWVSKPNSGACASVVASGTSTSTVPGANVALDDICRR